MYQRVSVATQGIDVGLDQATGEYETIERGEMDRNQAWEFLYKVQQFPIHPDFYDRDDLCPPHVMFTNPGGLISLIKDNQQYYSPDTGEHYTAEEALAFAMGEATFPATEPTPAPPPPRPSVAGAKSSGPGAMRKLFGFIMIVLCSVVGVRASQEAMAKGEGWDVIGMIIGIMALLAWFFWWLIVGRANKRARQVDSGDAAGAASGMMMADLINDDDFGDADD